MKLISRFCVSKPLRAGVFAACVLAQPGHAQTPPSPTQAETTEVKDEDEIIANAVPIAPDPAAEKFWQAVKLLKSNKPSEVVAGRAALTAVSDDEYPHAQTLLANCLLSGSYGFKKDLRKAVNLFRLAAERGNGYAQVSLGSCYVTGTGIRKDETKAVTWLTSAVAPDTDFSRPPPPRAADGSDATPYEESSVAGELATDPASSSIASAHYLLAQILTRQEKLTEAQTHFVAAATAGPEGKSGNYAAAVQAALNYAFGHGVPRDSAKANAMLDQSRRLNARWGVSLIHNYVELKIVDEFAVADLEERMTEASEGYHSSLQFKIASDLADKKSKSYNIADAVKWYELAADSGQAWAMIQLAQIYYQGDLGKPDYEKTFYWLEKAGGGENPKNLFGTANLAVCYYHGIGTPKSPEKAAELFKQHRNAHILFYLGSIGQPPAGPISAEQAIKLTETWARDKKDPHAQYLLGVLLRQGWGVKANRSEAERFFKRAGTAANGAALNALGELQQTSVDAFVPATQAKTLAKAAAFYQQAAAAGSASGYTHYADLLADGRGVPVDLAKAEANYLEGLKIDPKYGAAHNNLARIYEKRLIAVYKTIDGDAIATNRTLMLKHYEEAMGLGVAVAATNLGLLYAEGHLVKQDYRKAYNYYETATQLGSTQAHYTLGLMHENGLGVEVTYTEAAYHYRLAGLEGHRDSLLRLANFYLGAKGVSLDLDRAIFWLNLSARLGNQRAYVTICDILIKKENYATAIPLLRKMVDHYDAFISGYAYDRLSLCYARGLGVKPNPNRAKKYADLAVKKGNGSSVTELALKRMREGKMDEGFSLLEQAAFQSSEARYFLGQMYYFGTNVEMDTKKGLMHLRIAAQMNHAKALYLLAGLTYNREKDAPSLEEAIRFAQQAEAIGHEEAATLREKLEIRRRDQPDPE